jgi:SAM-dependent methyltransferase
MGPWIYDLMYRRGAPWEGGPRSELVGLVTSGALTPESLPRAIDLGCGSGANAVFLAERGFDVTGVDFSAVALAKARRKADQAGVADRCRFLEADLTAGTLAGVDGRFDLLVDYGTLDDLRGRRRHAMAALVTQLANPGSRFLLWCFQGPKHAMPWISFHGPSRIAAGLAPGEEATLFGGNFDITRLPEPRPETLTACYLLTRTTPSRPRIPTSATARPR